MNILITLLIASSCFLALFTASTGGAVSTGAKCPPVTCRPECQTVIVDGCDKCVCPTNPCAVVRCRGGYECVVKEVICVKAPCPPIAECVPRNSSCSCHGDPHCTTFDGAGLWDYQGTCEYILSQSLPNVQPAFAVLSKNMHLNGNNLVSYVQYVRVDLFNDVVLMETAAPYSMIINTKVNGNIVVLPYITANYRVDLFANFVRLTTFFGLYVEYTNYFSLQVTLSSVLQNKVEGYCGNFNGNVDDDATDRQGKRIPDIGRDTGAALGASWVTRNTEDCVSSPNINIIPRECPAVRKRCEQITNPIGIFRECINLLPDGEAKRYFESCVFDAGVTCDDQSACNSIQGFVQLCRSHGVIVAWREATYCPCKCGDENAECPLTEVKACPATCADPLQTQPCNQRPLRDVCVCKSGYVLQAGKCVATASCGCVDSTGAIRKINEVWIGPGCTEQLTCRKGGVITSKQYTCPSKTTCFNGACVDPCTITRCLNGEVCKIQCFTPTCQPPRTTCVRA